MANFGPIERVPEQFRQRNIYRHNASVTLMRTTPDECARLGAILAVKLNAARGPAAVFVPRRGVSMLSVAGQPFHDAEADAALFAALKRDLAATVALYEFDTDINDPLFAKAMAVKLDRMISKASRLARSHASSS
jgi:uncharacterized protein (UPF0261 family)